jgi:hypothetical protein
MMERRIMLTCREHLDRFFRTYPDPATQRRAMKVLRFLGTGGDPLSGKPGGWAGGIIYALATRGRRPCGVQGFLNTEFELFFGVSMDTVRRRAAQVERAMEI